MENLAEIYRKNVFSFKDTQRASFTIETIPLGVYSTPWAIITAWDPDNNTLSQEQNDARNLELKNLLHVRGFNVIECIGGLDDHFEESFLVEKIVLDEALELGKMFGQYAIVHHDGKKCAYYEVNTKNEIVTTHIRSKQRPLHAHF